METSTTNYSDSWNASISCTAPSATWINTTNAGTFHNNIIKSVDNSFTVDPTTLLTADNNAKNYEKNYINAQHIDVSATISDSGYGFRNRICGIKYSDNAIYASRIDIVHIADSMLNLSNTSVLMTTTEKTLMHNLMSYLDQYQKGQISYTSMKANIASIRTTWGQQGFNTALHQGDISAYTILIADSSITFWNRYNGTGSRISNRDRDQAILALPLWLGLDALGALGGAIGAGVDSYLNSGSVNWKSVGAWALGGAVGASVPGTRWFTKFFK
ncbi:MAG: hypothetical protein JSS98_01380 [Bacteroidetes bacterium]|nr:hypothetical protein [Bacteroidota bacterium]MBS1735240.1 hypothetical protein [Bacteroidota bacterium]